MRNFLLAFALAVMALPVAAQAQGFPDLSPDARAQIMQARTDAKTAAFNALSADHRTKIEAIVAKFDSGSLSIEDAATQIDGVLTADESKAVLAQQQKMRDAMRKVMDSQTNGSPPPGGQGRPPAAAGNGRRAPDAGRFLLQLAASPDALRAAMQP